MTKYGYKVRFKGLEDTKSAGPKLQAKRCRNRKESKAEQAGS